MHRTSALTFRELCQMLQCHTSSTDIFGFVEARRSRTFPRSKPECKRGQDMLQVSGW